MAAAPSLSVAPENTDSWSFGMAFAYGLSWDRTPDAFQSTMRAEPLDGLAISTPMLIVELTDMD